MKQRLAIIIISAASVGGSAAGWLLLPSLQSSKRAVQVEASLQLERARRLLHQYAPSLAYKSLLADQLGEQGIEVDPDELSDDVADEYQQLHATMWEAYQPTDWLRDPPVEARARYGDLSGQIREGLLRQARLAADNEQLLDQALATVNQALLVTDGEESSRSHAEANRLKAVILYHMGLAERTRARLHRREGDRYRRELAGLAAESAGQAAMKSLVADSNIDEEIHRLEAEADKTEAAIQEDRTTLEALDERIGDLETRLADARSRADQARQAVDRLKAEGIDFSDPDAAENFRIRLEQQSRAYREAARTVHALQYGTYPNAQMDLSGDYLHGRYVEEGSTADLTIEFGLVHYRNEHAVLTATIAGRQGGLDDARADIERLIGSRSTYEATQRQAVERLAKIPPAASDAYGELNRIESEAFAIEETALDLLERAARSAGQAAGFADRWVQEAGERTRGLSSEARRRSAFDIRSHDRWMSGFTAAQEADARLVKAWIHYDRYQAYTQNEALLDRLLKSVPLREVDVETERTKAVQARDDGVEEITQAMKVLERVHGQVEDHWTITAQGAGTTYLLVLFGFENYVQDTIAAYRNAVKGREDEPFTAPFLVHLNRLEKR